MTEAKGIHDSPLFKLGTAPAQERAGTPALRDGIFDARNRFRKNVIDTNTLDRAFRVFETVSA